ncbi:sensor histidine kinase [Jonesia quinghaiensis]|uniref:sensor histidine kinase n=1 Tax=Jonesia quinghaiensis TaxID=262806 RepID=UPI000685B983|nr:histidine kinase [Jonesia quinghaiensis]
MGPEWKDLSAAPARQRAKRIVGDVVGTALIFASAMAPHHQTGYVPSSTWGYIIVLSPIIVLPLRRRFPREFVATAVALYVVAASLGVLSPGIVVALAFGMFAVSNRYPRRVSVAICLGAIAIIMISSNLVPVEGVSDPRIVQFAALIAFGAAAGDAARSHRELIRQAFDRAERAEQTREIEAQRRVTEERLRIARDLHDAVAHQISVISLNAGVATSVLETNPTAARESLERVRGAARTVLTEIGDLMRYLRAEDSDDNTGPTKPQVGIDHVQDLIQQFETAGLDVTSRHQGDLTSIQEIPGQVLYRVVQEGLTNAHKHGSEHRAHVLISVHQDTATVLVTNPAVSTAQPQGNSEKAGGRGLLGLRERTAAVGGHLESGHHGGTYRLSATVPTAGHTHSDSPTGQEQSLLRLPATPSSPAPSCPSRGPRASFEQGNPA